MKKHLLVLAISAAVVAPGVAMASADLYGKLNLSLDHVDGAEGTGAGGNYIVTSNKSYFGIRGGTDLDGGLRGSFQLEFGIYPDQAIGTPIDFFTPRNTFLGLEGGFGMVKIGRFDTPVRTMGFAVDQFHDQIYADNFNLMEGEWRADNVIQYTTPKLGDLVTVDVATVAAEGNPDGGPGSNNKLFETVSIAVNVDLGEMYVGVGYDKNNFGSAGSNGLYIPDIAGLQPVAAVPGGIEAATNDLIDIIRIVAGANFDSLELGLLLQEAEDVIDSNNKDTTFIISAGLGLSDAMKLKLQLGQTEGDASDLKKQQFSGGVDYKLGDQTKVYGYATRQEFDPSAGSTTRSVAAVGVGAEHRF